ncbi:DUF4184 family protein [Microbacterium mitrae]|uniref:DUF4184 family protein n=1 Tax=Microbacterium mitrae TaxID=664640 RepID=A0A5C8HQ69_9MICO|nr:DUF4184 family protein [Microbacterium mitrae]TXK04695.1 DUF4184 family protein [Microbacterium mitrae]
MPFTVSHAVVALPFLRTPLIPGAIAIGAMAPDLPLFVRQVVPSYSTTHNLEAIAITLVLALLLFVLWRLVLRPAAAHLVPGAIAERLPQDWQQSTRQTLRESFVRPRTHATVGGTTVQVAVALASLALGIVSHVVWDSFTHEGRQDYAWLAADWGPLPAFKWLQHGSSLISLVVLAVWGVWWLSRRERVPVASRLRPAVRIVWLSALPVFLIAATVWGFVQYGPLTDEWTLAHLAYRVLPPACAVWALLTLVLCVVAVVRRAPATHEQPATRP